MKTDHTWETVAINTGVKHIIVLLMQKLFAFVHSRSHIHLKLNQIKVLQSKPSAEKTLDVVVEKNSGLTKLPLNFSKSKGDFCGASYAKQATKRVEECLFVNLSCNG